MDADNFKQDGERIENTGFGMLIQNPKEFCYGVDAVLLADYAVSFLKSGYTSIDLGTGTGIIPMIMNCKKPAGNIIGIEVQQNAAERAGRTMIMNSLEDVIKIMHADVKDITDSGMTSGFADMVTANPPYVTKGSGLYSGSEAKFIARQETTACLEDFVYTASWLLKERGHFCMVHRPSRLVDIMYSCRKHRLEPKNIRFVSPTEEAVPNIVLIHCVKGGGPELEFQKNLYIYESDRSYSSEIMSIYERI